MSVDTRTPRPGFDDQPPLSMLKVDCDPAQVIVNHASFRVKLASPQRLSSVCGAADPARIPAMSGAGGGVNPAPPRPPTPVRGAAPPARTPAMSGAGGGRPARRRAPVVWSGRS